MDPKLKYSENYYVRTLLNKVKIKEVMSPKVICVSEDALMSDVEKKIRDSSIRHLPVVDGNNRLTGLITQRDLYRLQSPRQNENGEWYYDAEAINNYILKHVMTKNPYVLGAESSIGEALLAMADRKYGCIPIVDRDGKLCGIITQTDILKIAARIIRE